MREKLETLPVTTLRELAKTQGVKASGLKKSELIDRLCEAAEKKNAADNAGASKAAGISGASGTRSSSKTASTRSTAGTGAGTARPTSTGVTGTRITAAQRTGALMRGQSSSGTQQGARTAASAYTGAAQERESHAASASVSRGGRTLRTTGLSRTVGNASPSRMESNDIHDGYSYDGRHDDYEPQDRHYVHDDGYGYNDADVRGGHDYAREDDYDSRDNYRYRRQSDSADRRADYGDGDDDYRGDYRTDADYRRGTTVSVGRNQLAGGNDYSAGDYRRSTDYRSDRGYMQESGDRAVSQQKQSAMSQLDSGIEVGGILEVMQEGFGFIRSENFLPGDNDVYVAPSQIRRFSLRTGDVVRGNQRVKTAAEKFAALLYVNTVNGQPPRDCEHRPSFEKLTPIFPDERIRLSNDGEASPLPLRVMDLLAPIGKGQRGLIVSPPKAGKTTLLKQIAKSIIKDENMHLLILLVDERPEEVTDIKEEVVGDNVEVIYSTFDELPDRHKRVSEMVIERARRLVEYGQDVTILLDSITRLSRAYNLVVPTSGRTLSGGLDPTALYMPKKFFGAARNVREGGSITILATALINTGSKMDDVIYEEFKGTGNMELVLDRKLSEKRIFPAIDILKSGTRRDDLLLTPEELNAVNKLRGAVADLTPADAMENVIELFTKTHNNTELVKTVERMRM